MTDAIILAAGYGKRMRPLTHNIPKPLIKVHNKPLIEHHIERLVRLGVQHIWININLDHHGLQIPRYLGDGSKWGVAINYFYEQKPLDTGTSLLKLSTKIRSTHVWVISSDIWINQDVVMHQHPKKQNSYIYVVPRPHHCAQGDFHVQKNKQVPTKALKKNWTYSGIGLYSLDTIKKIKRSTNHIYQLSLKQILDQISSQKKLHALFYQGIWADIGTPNRLAQIENLYLGEQ